MLLPTGALASQHTQGSSPLGETIWPPADHQSVRSLPDLVRPLYRNASTPVLGVNPIDFFKIDMVNTTASEVRIRERGGVDHTFDQAHQPVNASGGVTIHVNPGQLRPMIEVRPFPERFAQQVLHLYGPPGTFNLTGNSTRDKITEIRERLRFPEPVDYRLDPGVESALPLLYHGEESCLDRANGECTAEGYFQIQCPDCTQVSFAVSGLDQEFREAFGTSPRMGTSLGGGAIVLLDPGGHVISITLGYAYDLNESAVLSPTDARNQVFHQLPQRGYETGNISHVDTGRLSLVTPSDRIDPSGARYHWDVAALNASGREVALDVVQDAESGQILEIDARPAAIPSGPDNPLPAPGLAALLAAVAVAAVAWTRFRKDR